MAQLTTIRELNPDRVPETVKASVISLWSSTRGDVAREGRLEDETGIIPFILWANSSIKDLEKGQKYIFHRAGLGEMDGELRVQLDELTTAYPVNEEADVYRTMLKITQLEETERKRFARGAKITRKDRGRPSRNKFSIAIAAGFVIWAVIMVLVFTDLVTEKKIRSFFLKERSAAQEIAVRKAATVTREGTVEGVPEGGAILVRIGDEQWTIHYLGLEVPRMPARKGVPIDPLALQALNFNKYLARGKTVRLEFEESLPPEDGEGQAYVFVGDTMLNASLLERGLARLTEAGKKMSYGDQLLRAEESARQAGKGIWRE